MIYCNGKFRVIETPIGKYTIEKNTIGGWSPFIKDSKMLEFETKEEADQELNRIRKEWEDSQ
ncbi:hypothetical protein [Enterococcus sp. AZ126]|uniref:hypothetical protein n=1 Tax=Enterococcus sp. AZ126 TaxID=2774635 RepID=UPI003F286C3E